LIITLFLLVGTSIGQQPCKRHVEPLGGFSVCPPEGWALVEPTEGQKYKKFFAPPVNDFKANLNFRDETAAIGLTEYTDASISYILSHTKDMGTDSTSLVSKSDITTAAGLTGKKAVLISTYKGFNIRSAVYFFSGRTDLKILLTFTSLEADKERDDKMFDAVARTLKFENQ
jgi:hypothetical protein